MNASLQTFDRPARLGVTDPLREFSEQFDRATLRPRLDSGSTQLLRSSLAVRQQGSRRDGAYLIAVQGVAHACREKGCV